MKLSDLTSLTKGGIAKLFTKAATVEEESVDLSGYGPLLQLGLLANGAITARTAVGALAAYRQSSAISIPVRMISSDISMLVPVIETDGDVDQTPAAEDILALLNNPGDIWLKGLFLETLAVHQSVTSNCYVWAGGNINRPPLALAPVSPDLVTFNANGDGVISSVVVMSGPYKGIFNAKTKNGLTRYLNGSFAELKHIKGFSSRGNDIIGESPLVSIAYEVEQMIRGNTHNSSLMANGGRLSALFSLQGDLTPEEYKAARDEIRRQFTGSNSGKIAVTMSDDVKITEFGTTPKDMDYAKLLVIARDACALQFGVPAVLITQQSATFNNMASASEMLFDNGVSPIARRIFSGLQELLFPRFGIDNTTSTFLFDELQIPSVRGRRIRELKERREANVETVNELRMMVAREPIAGGDKLYLPAASTPMEEGSSRPSDILAMRAGREISQPTFISEMQRRGVLSDDVDATSEAGLIEEEGPLLGEIEGDNQQDDD